MVPLSVIKQEDSMPFLRLITLLAVVIVAAAVTIAAVLALTGGLAEPSMLGLGILGLIGLCASFGFRVYSDRKAKMDDPDQ
jgi:hypothetical protein